MKFRKYKLADVCNIQIGKTPRRDVKEYWGKGYSWLSISDMKSDVITTTKEEITESAVKKCGCKLILEGTILLSFKLSIGKIAFAGKDLFTNEAIVGLEIKDRNILHPAYLFYVLKNIPLIGSNNAAMGATLNKESLKILQLPVPETISDQLHIANLLTKAENLISQRKQSITLLDEFLKSTFLEMFGDPGINPCNWPLVKLGKVFLDKPLIGSMVPAIECGKIPIVRVGELGKREINFSKSMFSNLSELEHKKYRLQDGDVLLARAIGSESHLGKASIYIYTGFPVVYDSHVMRIRFEKKIIHPDFFYTFLQTQGGRKRFMQKAGQTAVQFNINSKQISDIDIPLPPISLQIQYSQIIKNSESLKAQYQSSLQELENLYGSLSQRAFRGEL